jgi:hypothetical protein
LNLEDSPAIKLDKILKKGTIIESVAKLAVVGMHGCFARVVPHQENNTSLEKTSWNRLVKMGGGDVARKFLNLTSSNHSFHS